MNNDTEKYEMDKKEFLELYEKSKKGKIDLYSLPKETLEKICTLLREEIKMQERDIKILKSKLENC